MTAAVARLHTPCPCSATPMWDVQQHAQRDAETAGILNWRAGTAWHDGLIESTPDHECVTWPCDPSDYARAHRHRPGLVAIDGTPIPTDDGPRPDWPWLYGRSAPCAGS